MTPGNLQKCIGAKSCTGFPVRNERNKITLFELALSFLERAFFVSYTYSQEYEECFKDRRNQAFRQSPDKAINPYFMNGERVKDDKSRSNYIIKKFRS